MASSHSVWMHYLMQMNIERCHYIIMRSFKTIAIHFSYLKKTDHCFYALPLDLDFFSLAELAGGELSFVTFFFVFFLGVSSSSSSSSSSVTESREMENIYSIAFPKHIQIWCLLTPLMMYLSSFLEHSWLSFWVLSLFLVRLYLFLLSFSSPSSHL